MKTRRFLTLIAVFTAFFASCEEPQENNGNTYDGNNINFKCLKTLEGHSFYVTSVAYSPDGTKIISGSHDKTIKIWNANTGQCLQTLKGHSDIVYSVAY
ncbi:MAG: hypothetical protein U0L54_03740, partial [Bacteroidales bacterium]|nr:hypothetical protein [Bacteroidales bacterium]